MCLTYTTCRCWMVIGGRYHCQLQIAFAWSAWCISYMHNHTHISNMVYLYHWWVMNEVSRVSVGTQSSIIGLHQPNRGSRRSMYHHKVSVQNRLVYIIYRYNQPPQKPKQYSKHFLFDWKVYIVTHVQLIEAASFSVWYANIPILCSITNITSIWKWHRSCLVVYTKLLVGWIWKWSNVSLQKAQRVRHTLLVNISALVKLPLLQSDTSSIPPMNFVSFSIMR